MSTSQNPTALLFITPGCPHCPAVLAQTRADACYFLGLTGVGQALPAVRRLLEDEHPDVRDIARATIAMLDEAPEGEAGR